MLIGEGTFKAGHFQHADQGFVGQDRNISKRLQGAPRMQVGIIRTHQLTPGEEQCLFLIGNYAQRAAVERHDNVVEVNFTEGCFGDPVRLILFFNYIDDGRAARERVDARLVVSDGGR